MKNKILVLILLVVIIMPQVASASWWNPFSWKVFTRFFEPKVEEIQKVNSTEDTASTTNEVSEIEKLRTELEELKNQKVDNNKTTPATQTTKQTTPTPTVSTPQIKTTTMSRDELFADVMQKYKGFQNTVINERNGLAKNSSLPSERGYFTYLDDVLNKINSDLGYLEGIKSWSSRPAIEETYLLKFNNLINDYNSKVRGYRIDFEEERTIVSQQNMEELKQQAADSARKNSPECIKWTSLLKDIAEQIKPLQAIGDKRREEYLTTGKYTTPDLSSSDRIKLTDLMLRQSGAQNEYYYYCEGFVPSSPKTTSCSFYGNTMYCQ